MVPGQAEPWAVSNHGFRLLAGRAATRLPVSADRDVLAAAESHGALFVDQIAEPARSRICAALVDASRTLRAELASGDDWARTLASHLPTLEMWLEGLAPE